MATGAGGDRNWGQDYRNTCSLCMESFRSGRLPKLLPCFHTFCLPCLTALADTAAKSSGETPTTTTTTTTTAADDTTLVDDKTKVESTEDEKNDDGEASPAAEENKKEGESGDVGQQSAAEPQSPTQFLCPTCRCPVTVPEGGVENLQTNFYLDLDVTASRSGPVSCDMCEEGEREEATHYCVKCQQHMCRTCRRLHDKFTDASSHKVQPVQARDRQPKGERQNSCHLHLDQSLCLHCLKCDVSICMLCKLTSHEGHTTEDMATANIRAREELKGLLTKANEQVQVMDSTLSRLDRKERELLRQKQDVTREVGMRYEKAVATIARVRDDVIEDLTTRHRTAINEIRSQQMSARNTVETLTGLLNRARHETDVVTLKNDVQAALLSEDALDKCRQTTASKDDVFFQFKADTSELEEEMVKAYMGQLKDPDSAQTSGDQTVLSFRDLADNVTKLTSNTSDLTGKFGDLQNRVTKVQSEIACNSTELASVTQFSTQVSEKLKTETTDITKKLGQLQTAVTKLEGEASNNSTQLAKITKITSRTSEVLSRVAAFRADLGTEWNKSNGDTIKFQTIVYNDGGCYNKDTSEFIAPYDGLYTFHVVVRASQKVNDVEVSIRMNGSPCSWVRGTHTCYGSSSVTQYVTKGSCVYVELFKGELEAVETRFSGALIHASIKD